MSVQPSTLKCPSCADQLLETITTALGALERCPWCLGLWVEQKLIAAYSDDKTACREALAETKTLLLPAERWCPKCFQKMLDGRVRSRAVVLHLCTTCDALWTDWETLHKFDEFIARALKAQVEAATQHPTISSPNPFGTPGPSYSAPSTVEDNGVSKVFRSIARTFDSLADGVASTSAYPLPNASMPKSSKPPAKQPLPKKVLVKNKEKERKILKADELPPASVEKEMLVVPEPIINAAGMGAEVEAPVVPDPVISGTGTTGAEVEAPVAPDPVISGTGTTGAEVEAPVAPDPIISGTGTTGAEVEAPVVPAPVISGTGTTGAEKEAPVAPDPVISGAETTDVEVKTPVDAEPVISGAGATGVEIQIPVQPDPLIPEPVISAPVVDIAAPVIPPVVAEPEPLKAEVSLEKESSNAISNLLGGVVWEIPDKKKTPAKELKLSAPAIPETRKKIEPAPLAKKPVEIAKSSAPKKESASFIKRLVTAFKPKPKTQASLPPSVKPPVSSTAPSTVPVPLAPAPLAAKVKTSQASIFKSILKKKPKEPKVITPIAPPPVTPVVMPPVTPVIPPATVISGPVTVKTKPSLLAGFKSFFKTRPKSSKPVNVNPVVKPASMMAKPQPPASVKGAKKFAEETSLSNVLMPKEIQEPAPLKSITKPTPVLPKKKAAAKGWGWRLLPWGLALIAFLINYLRGYDFEFSYALLWSACAWSVGTMIRLAVLYPFKEFVELSLNALGDYPGLTAAQGLPVLLTGWLEPKDPSKPKGVLIFSQGDQTLEMNQWGKLELIPRFFGLQNPGQLIAGEATLQGWYRKTAAPYVEIAVVTVGKKRRASMVRGVRWAAAIAVLVLAGLILLTAE